MEALTLNGFHGFHVVFCREKIVYTQLCFLESSSRYRKDVCDDYSSVGSSIPDSWSDSPTSPYFFTDPLEL